MLAKSLFAAVFGFGSIATAQFGLTDNDDSYVINAGSANSLVVTVNKASCDVTSIVYRGTELQVSSPYTHIGSGLGSASVSATTIDDQYIKVTCETDTLTHYIVAKSGESNLYMATFTSAEPEIGELRYIARLDSSILPSSYPFGDVSKTVGSTSTVEGSDVFVVDGETRSKFYSSERFIDDHVHCVYGDDTHACFVKPEVAYEASSGGPFFRDIDTNNGGDYTSLTFYMNSGHVQTEEFRQGLHGPYALTFSRSGIPKLAEFDFSFFADLDIEGYVAESGRGYVSGTASGIGSDYQPVVHWFNDEAQYWAYTSSGAFTSPAMKPGTYTMKLYQTELEVASQSVEVSAGSTTTSDIASTLEAPATSLWTIGSCDGQPTGFLNADKQLRMHPSDARMSDWGPTDFVVGDADASAFPMALFQAVNSGQNITFTLDDASSDATLRIRTTLAFASGRPQVTVNSWSGDIPAAPTKIDSRGVTRGAYRGYGEAYEFDIPSSELVAGQNSIQISVASGSSGDTFLSPNFILDCIELYR